MQILVQTVCKACMFAVEFRFSMKKGLLYVVAIIIITKIMALSSGCANIIPPTGGPRDSLPPQLLKVTPNDSTLGFTSKKIDFYFDEYVELQNIQENLIVSPTLKINPVVEYKLRNVTVRIKDTLEPNTTYSINFGKAIRDINEGNELKDYTYVFSTGTRLDNNQFSGNVVVAETGKTDSTLIVLLHRNGDDSAVIKERPRYIAKLDSSGNFTFRNLPTGNFFLYALKDEGSTRRYQSTSQLFAFSDTVVAVNEQTERRNLYAYAETIEAPRRTPAATPSAKGKAQQREKRLAYTTTLENNQQDLLSNLDFQFGTPLKVFDSTKLSFSDITYQTLGNYSFTRDSLLQKVTLIYPWKPDSTYHIVLNKDFAEDSTGSKILKTDTLTFKAKKETDYGTLRLRFPALDLSRQPVLQFIQGEKIVYTYTFSAKDFSARLFKTGEYELRILYDANRNGKWDAGSFFGKRLQPERAQAINKKITVKANWENDETIDAGK